MQLQWRYRFCSNLITTLSISSGFDRSEAKQKPSLPIDTMAGLKDAWYLLDRLQALPGWRKAPHCSKPLPCQKILITGLRCLQQLVR